jgi:hypothetical protein
MSEIIGLGDLVLLPIRCPTGRVVRIQGKGTPEDPVYAVVEIPAETRLFLMDRLMHLEAADG